VSLFRETASAGEEESSGKTQWTFNLAHRTQQMPEDGASHRTLALLQLKHARRARLRLCFAGFILGTLFASGVVTFFAFGVTENKGAAGAALVSIEE